MNGNHPHAPRDSSISSLASQGQQVSTGTAKSRTSKKFPFKSDAAAEKQLPTPRSKILKTLANTLFGDQQDRTTLGRIWKPNTPSWNHEYHIGDATNYSQLKGVALSANSQSNQLDITKPVVLFFGGSHSPVEEAAYGAAEICCPQAGINFLALNYRGFGESSEISPSPASLIEDAKAAYQHLRDLGFPSEKIIVRGYSLGACAASHLHAISELKGEKLGGVIYDRPMTSLQKAATGATNFAPAGFITKVAAGSFGAIPNLKVVDHFVSRTDRETPVIVIADDGTHPNNDFLGPAAIKLAKDFELELHKSGGDHEDHARANVAAITLLGKVI